MSYKLTDIASRPKGTIVYLPLIAPRHGAEVDYNKAMKALLRGIQEEAIQSVLVAYKRHITTDEKAWFSSLHEKTSALIETAISLVKEILRLESDRHSQRFVDSVKKALSIDIKAVVSASATNQLLLDYAERNAALITSLGDDAIKDIKYLVYTAKLEGLSARELSEQLKAKFKTLGNRADLIAGDQLSKLNADLNEFRHREAGVDDYVWRTSRDERVRERHSKLDGKHYKYGQKTEAEQGGSPGKPVRCRCIAQAVVKF